MTLHAPNARLPLMVLVAWAGTSATFAQEGDQGQKARALAERLRERESRILDIGGTFETSHVASDFYVAAMASSRKESPNAIREESNVRCVVEYAFIPARDTRLFSLRRRRIDPVHESHSLLAHDGKAGYWIASIPEAGERRVSTVILDEAVFGRFSTECHPAILLGLVIPHATESLSEAILRHGGVVTESVPFEGIECVQVEFAFDRPGEGEDPPRPFRYTAFLDPAHALAIRGIRLEMRDRSTSDWLLVGRWEVASFQWLDRPGLWFPTEATHHGSLGEKFALGTTTITFPITRINAGLSAAVMTPLIEDGSNVIDKKTNTSSIYGNRLSGRIQGFIEEAIEDSRKEVEATRAQGALRQVSPRSRWEGKLLMAAGLVLLLGAGVWQWRQRIGLR